jgi:hypothetical protein
MGIVMGDSGGWRAYSGMVGPANAGEGGANTIRSYCRVQGDMTGHWVLDHSAK